MSEQQRKDCPGIAAIRPFLPKPATPRRQLSKRKAEAARVARIQRASAIRAALARLDADAQKYPHIVVPFVEGTAIRLHELMCVEAKADQD